VQDLGRRPSHGEGVRTLFSTGGLAVNRHISVGRGGRAGEDRRERADE
jgi:hypothetical protein